MNIYANEGALGRWRPCEFLEAAIPFIVFPQIQPGVYFGKKNFFKLKKTLFWTKLLPNRFLIYEDEINHKESALVATTHEK